MALKEPDDTEIFGTVGHNSGDGLGRFVVKGFNSISPYVKEHGAPRAMALPLGSTLRDLVRELAIPDGRMFLAFKNGRDVTAGIYYAKDPVINLDVEIDEGDHISFSGPVPYSYGYGSAVV